MDLTLAVFAVVGFLAVVLALEGAYNIWTVRHSAEARRIKERLHNLTEGGYGYELSLERERADAAGGNLDKLLAAIPGGGQLAHWVQASGLQTRPAEVLLWSLIAGFAVLTICWTLGFPLALIVGAVLLAAAVPWIRISRARHRRLVTMENQFPDALDLICRSLRAGHAFQTSIKTVGVELPDPLAKDFRILSDEINFGVPMADAFKGLCDRIPIADVRFFMVAVLIQRDTGGNLAEVLEKISGIVRARLKLLGEVRTLSAEGRLSAIILTCLPFVVGGVVAIVNPDFMSILFVDPLGLKLIAAALLLMISGILWMRRVVQIRL